MASSPSFSCRYSSKTGLLKFAGDEFLFSPSGGAASIVLGSFKQIAKIITSKVTPGKPASIALRVEMKASGTVNLSHFDTESARVCVCVCMNKRMCRNV
jgi:hypothetical protein